MPTAKPAPRSDAKRRATTRAAGVPKKRASQDPIGDFLEHMTPAQDAALRLLAARDHADEQTAIAPPPPAKTRPPRR
jgi:hypothetical protein